MAPKQEEAVVKLRSFSSALETTKEARSQPDESETYLAWRTRFTWERLTVLYLLGLVANVVFIASDYFFYRQHLEELLTIRGILELGLPVLGVPHIAIEVHISKGVFDARINSAVFSL